MRRASSPRPVLMIGLTLVFILALFVSRPPGSPLAGEPEEAAATRLLRFPNLSRDSIAFVYAGAEWQEREIWDLFGVTFRAHPDLRRILLPDEYDGHPLRKSFAMDTPWGYRPATAAAPEGAS